MLLLIILCIARPDAHTLSHYYDLYVCELRPRTKRRQHHDRSVRVQRSRCSVRSSIIVLVRSFVRSVSSSRAFVPNIRYYFLCVRATVDIFLRYHPRTHTPDAMSDWSSWWNRMRGRSAAPDRGRSGRPAPARRWPSPECNFQMHGGLTYLIVVSEEMPDNLNGVVCTPQCVRVE